MSVLIEAFSLVVPRRLLYLGYGRGIESFEVELSRPSAEHRFVCADTHLMSVSFFTREAAERAAGVLTSAGLTGWPDRGYADFAIVDQHSGPLLECHWLEWTREPQGHSCAWLADAERGELAVPPGWSPGQSRHLARPGLRSPEDKVLLSDESGIESWLNLRTGHIVERQKLRGLP